MSNRSLIPHTHKEMTAEMREWIPCQSFTRPAEIVIQNYGKDPAEIASTHLADRKSKTVFRGYLEEFNMSLFFVLRADLVDREPSDMTTEENQWVRENILSSALSKELQKRLDTREVEIILLNHYRRQHAHLTDDEFYPQAIEYIWTATELVGEIRHRENLNHAIEEVKREHPEALEAIKEEYQAELQAAGYLQSDTPLQCDLLPDYLAELVAKQQEC